MIEITGTPAWQAAHPGAMIGLLEISGVEHSGPSAALNARKRETEARLRCQYAGFTRQDFVALPAAEAYVQYYKRFDKTFHVLQQVESIVLKGKDLPDVSPLVDANFCAEVETWGLTAGHDADQLAGPLVIDVSVEGDTMTQMSGVSRPVRAGDMVMRDGLGLCCTVIYGQDNRSPITPATRHVLYVVYAPAGVALESVEDQLRKIEENVRLFALLAKVEQSKVLRA